MVVLPDALCVITLFDAVHSDAGTFHSFAAAWISIMRAAAPPSRTYFCDSRMPRLPPVENAPQARLRATFCAGRRIFGRDLRPVALQLFGDELGEAGQRALAHFGAGDADDDGVVGPDHDPDADLRRAVRGADHVGADARSRGRAPGRRRPRRCR